MQRKLLVCPDPTVPCFLLQTRDSPVPAVCLKNTGHWIVPAVLCFLIENTGQSRPGCVSENTGHWIVLSRVFSLKTRGSPVPAVCLKIRDIGLFRPGCPYKQGSRCRSALSPIHVILPLVGNNTVFKYCLPLYRFG